LPITLSLVLFLIVLPSVHVPVAHGAIYTPGVTIGQYVDYGEISFQSSGSAFNMQTFDHTIDLRDTVTGVVGNDVTISEKATFDNNTARIEILQGNVATGAGNLTFALIAGGLMAGDPVTQTPTVPGFSGFSSSINETVTRFYAGLLRSVNVGIEQPSLPGVTLRSAVYWDQQTGFALELLLTSFIPAGITSPTSPASTVSIHLKATSTNAWTSSNNSDFGLDITSLSPFILYQGSSDTFSVNLTSVGGFVGTVSLQAQLSQENSTVISPLTVSLSASSLILTSGQSSQSAMQISATTATNLGVYLITVNATTATLRHDGIFVVEVVPPDFELSPDTIFVSLLEGTRVSNNLMVRPLGAFSGTVVLSSFAIDPGLQVTLNTTSVTLSSGHSVNVQVNVTAASTVVAATYFGYIMANSGAQSHTAFAIINVIQLSPPTVVISIVSPNPAKTDDSVAVSFGVYSLATVTGISINWGDDTPTQTLAATASSDTHVYTGTGNSKSQTFKITINATNIKGVGSATYMETVNDQIPTAGITNISPATVYMGQTLTLSFSASDPDGTIASANVDWGDGTNTAVTGAATQASHSYSASGSFTIKVTVTDNSGNVASGSTTVTIPQPDINLASSSPSSTTTSQSSISTITISPTYGFTGPVTLSISAPSGIVCTLDHSTLQGSGTATLTCTSNTANDYSVTVTATGGASPHTTTQTFHVAAAPSPAAPAPTILGLSPAIFYVLIAVLIVAVIGGVVALTRRKKP